MNKERDKFYYSMNPPNLYDFSTWPRFGWLWQRAKKKGWWRKFFDNYKEYDGFISHIDPDRFADALCEFLSKEGSGGPDRFANALYGFLNKEGSRGK